MPCPTPRLAYPCTDPGQVTAAEGWMQGFVTCTTFTTWHHGFRWDSTNPALDLLDHAPEAKAPASAAKRAKPKGASPPKDAAAAAATAAAAAAKSAASVASAAIAATSLTAATESATSLTAAAESAASVASAAIAASPLTAAAKSAASLTAAPHGVPTRIFGGGAVHWLRQPHHQRLHARRCPPLLSHGH